MQFSVTMTNPIWELAAFTENLPHLTCISYVIRDPSWNCSPIILAVYISYFNDTQII